MTALNTWRRWMRWMALALLLALGTAPVWASSHKAKKESAPSPVARIPVAPLGFLAPNPSYLNSRLTWVSLDFIDDSHLLFTFHQDGLLRRIPGEPATNNDQEIQADVLDIATGKVLKQAHWRMRDRGRYLWPLRDGQFLIRVGNSLFLTDRDLVLKPYLVFDANLQVVELSPDRNLLLLEVQKKLPPAKNAKSAPPSLLSSTGVATQTRTELVMLRPGERIPLAEGETAGPVEIPLVENGYLDVKQGLSPNEWVINEQRVGKPHEAETVVATVKSPCPLKVEPLGGGVVLVESCLPHGWSGKSVRALRLSGGELWHELWQSKYIWPELTFDANGSRFAYESLEMDRDIGVMDAFGESDVVAQLVGVFDTVTDKPLLVVDASPVLSAGQNFALSPDGRRFAVLRNGAIEVYDLPATDLPATGTKSP